MEALLIPLSIFAVFVVAEAALPGRSFPRVPGWRLKGVVAMIAYMAVAVTAPMLWDAFLGAHRLMDGRSLGTPLGALVAFLTLEFFVYAWHRTMHRVPFLWRWFHQLHHSAERVDVFGAFYFHPLDAAGFTLVGSLALVWATGVTPEAAAIANLVSTVFAIFQHTNVNTPHWLGYVVQRPEAHSLHHERGVHAYNYGNLVWFDMLFGTYRNPRRWQAEAGLYDGASAEVCAMLLGRDVLEARTESELMEARASVS